MKPAIIVMPRRIPNTSLFHVSIGPTAVSGAFDLRVLPGKVQRTEPSHDG